MGGIQCALGGRHSAMSGIQCALGGRHSAMGGIHGSMGGTITPMVVLTKGELHPVVSV